MKKLINILLYIPFVVILLGCKNYTTVNQTKYDFFCGEWVLAKHSQRFFPDSVGQTIRYVFRPDSTYSLHYYSPYKPFEGFDYEEKGNWRIKKGRIRFYNVINSPAQLELCILDSLDSNLCKQILESPDRVVLAGFGTHIQFDGIAVTYNDETAFKVYQDFPKVEIIEMLTYIKVK